MAHALVLPVALLALLAFSTTTTHAQSTATKDEAAKLATERAQSVTLTDAYGHGAMGTLRLQRIGRTRTRVVLQVPGGTAPGRIELRRGTDCNANRNAAASSSIALNRVNDAHVSETIVDVPLDQLQSGNYLVAVRNATQRQQFYQACARLARRP